jgi:AcrR family transcriptional regulator
MPKVVPNYESAARERILTEAINTFHKLGYKGARMEIIAENLGVSKASIYTYYPSKAVLLQEVFTNAAEVVSREILELDERLLLNPEKLYARLRRFSDLSGPSLYFEILSEAMNDPVLMRIAAESSHRMTLKVANMIDRLKSRDEITGDVDSQALALGIISLYDGLMAQIALGKSEKDVKASWMSVFGSIMNGLRPCNHI